MRAIIFLFLLASTSLMTNGLREMVAQGGLDVEIECYLTVDELRFLGQLQVLWKWKPLVRFICCSDILISIRNKSSMTSEISLLRLVKLFLFFLSL